MRTMLLVAALLAASLAVPVPAEADACVRDRCIHWDCVQVYPWSRLCEGDVGGFLEAFLRYVCPDGQCIA